MLSADASARSVNVLTWLNSWHVWWRLDRDKIGCTAMHWAALNDRQGILIPSACAFHKRGARGSEIWQRIYVDALCVWACCGWCHALTQQHTQMWHHQDARQAQGRRQHQGQRRPHAAALVSNIFVYAPLYLHAHKSSTCAWHFEWKNWYKIWIPCKKKCFLWTSRSYIGKRLIFARNVHVETLFKRFLGDVRTHS